MQATRQALAAGVGDENFEVLPVKGRSCGADRFEMLPELWHVFSEGLGRETSRQFPPQGGSSTCHS